MTFVPKRYRRGARRKHGRDEGGIELEEGYSDEHQEFVQEAAAAHGFEMWVEATNTATPRAIPVQYCTVPPVASLLFTGTLVYRYSK